MHGMQEALWLRSFIKEVFRPLDTRRRKPHTGYFLSLSKYNTTARDFCPVVLRWRSGVRTAEEYVAISIADAVAQMRVSPQGGFVGRDLLAGVPAVSHGSAIPGRAGSASNRTCRYAYHDGLHMRDSALAHRQFRLLTLYATFAP
jgi:hypothetical protein